MKRGKKGTKIDFSNLDSLDHQPFAQLGAKWGIQAKDSQPEPATSEPAPEEKPQLFIRREKRKGNKWVTAIYHLGDNKKALLKTLKKRFASGGGIDDDALVIQGDHQQAITAWFESEGYSVRGSKP